MTFITTLVMVRWPGSKGAGLGCAPGELARIADLGCSQLQRTMDGLMGRNMCKTIKLCIIYRYYLHREGVLHSHIVHVCCQIREQKIGWRPRPVEFKGRGRRAALPRRTRLSSRCWPHQDFWWRMAKEGGKIWKDVCLFFSIRNSR